MHVTLSDWGGAGMACMRLHRALRELNVDSRVLVRNGATKEEGVYTAMPQQSSLRARIDRLPLLAYPRKKIFAWWSVNWIESGPRASIDTWTPDVIHAHWIGDGFLPIDWLAKTGKPFVWTMHDMWPFTGGCHYSQDCTRFRKGCGACPQLDSDNAQDLSYRSAKGKAKAWGSTNKGVFVTPSKWLAEVAKESAVLKHARVDVIPNGIDGSLFKPGDRNTVRSKFSLAQDEKIVLTGAIGAVRDERKGFHLLKAALHSLSAAHRADKWRLVVFGADSGPGEAEMGIPVTYLGSVHDERELPAAYQAADLFVLPSLQDNLPNTVVEALACGIPVVGFRSSGLATMITDGKTGKLATPFSTASLADALFEVMATDTWSRDCRDEFEKTYEWPGPAHAYTRLYRELTTTS
jgi:glycosyltransferase involved in cell wall biosynthesis